MRFSHLFSSAAVVAALLLAGQASAQVDTTGVKPQLDALPPLEEPPLLPPMGNPKQSMDNMPPAASPQTAPEGTFQPARPAQPKATLPAAKRPVPEGVGSPVPTTSEKESGSSKWFVTGNPDLGFSSSYGYRFFGVGVAAMLGYRITDRFAAGPGLVYNYSSISGNGV